MTIKLRNQVKCPHCWHVFPPYDALWIAEHGELTGDERLGEDHQQRFLPTRFTPNCEAIDARGMPCHRLACPRCHLEIPLAAFELGPIFVSTLGSPACGKSYFLTSMSWTLRNILPQRFALSYVDADNQLNARLQEYESRLFTNPDPDAFVTLPKTEMHGDLYFQVMIKGQSVQYLKPFLFTVKPLAKHPSAKYADSVGRLLCLYDNAGESFLPGADSIANPVTRHLAISDAIMFLFDPTQDARFRRAIRDRTDDPQMRDRRQLLPRENPLRQETILQEAAERIRRYGREDRARGKLPPLIVVVTKYDAWAPLLGITNMPAAWEYSPSAGICGLRMEVIKQVSNRTRNLLDSLAPELVGAIESLSTHVVYIPVSATGCPAEENREAAASQEQGASKPDLFGFRPRNIRPIWVEVPMLYFLARFGRGLVGILTQPKQTAARQQDKAVG